VCNNIIVIDSMTVAAMSRGASIPVFLRATQCVAVG
jgi:hypothetical protein